MAEGKGNIIELDPKDFTLEEKYKMPVAPGRWTEGAICYKGVPMRNGMSLDLSGYKFYILDQTMLPNGLVTLQCQDELGVSHHYGGWESVDSVKKWLEDPTAYARQTSR